MRKKTRSYQFFGSLLVLFVGACIMLFVSLSGAPDQYLHFSREVPSPLDANRLDRNVSSVTRWPQWFFSLDHVEVLSPSGEKVSVNTPIQKGSLLTLNIDPKKWQSKRFKITAQVLDYRPDHEISLKILNDSSGRLTHLFDDIQWKIEFLPPRQGTGSVIRATSSAHTCHWRSRFFGRLAEKILMNQIFYPDVVRLAELRQPFSAFEETSHPVPPISN